jgi:hypothetical protein
MGLLDFLGGGKGPDKALKLKPKVTQKYGDPATRQKAISQLGEMKGVPEAVSVLMERFKFVVDPATTDADEKDTVFNLIVDFGDQAVAPVRAFLERTDTASSWAVRLLLDLLPEAEVIGIAVEILKRLGAEYSRDPEKKMVLLQFVEGKDDPRIPEVALPFLEDMTDDVRLAALKVLGPLKHESAREPILKVLTSDETGKRVRVACIAALFESGFGVQGYREKVEAQLADPYFVDKAGAVKKRG